jgi:hypothetical protein
MRMMSSHSHRLRAERGFSMFLVIMAMFVTSMFVVAGFAAANGDLPLSANSKDRKLAYAAAEAGLNFYLTHLNQDDQYWTYCDKVPKASPTEAAPVNQPWDGKNTDPRIWRAIPGSTERYTIELLPAPGYSKCDPNNQASMIDKATGTFRIRATGAASKASGDKGERRTIVASFRRSGFLDFLWFTDYEDLDWAALPTSSQAAAKTNCAGLYRPKRPLQSSGKCTEINFVTGDSLNGPVHSNDSLLICGQPVFGRKNQSPPDKVETTVAPDSLHSSSDSGCTSNTATIWGIFKSPVNPMKPPASNASLRVIAQNGGDLFTGKTYIQLLANGKMNVSSMVNGVRTAQAGLPMPGDGVIYVQANTAKPCKPQFPTDAKYDDEDDCGNVYVSGSYSTNLTIAAAGDIVIAPTDGQSLTWGNAFGLDKAPGTDGVLGLIANNFIRVGHPVNRDSSGNCTGNAYSAYDNANLTITAAMLTLQHSFIVDNYKCGKPLGKLTVNGAIAQLYRGTVGTGGGSTGFLKNYWYDDRLRYRSPPHFINPIDSAWGIVRSNEQVATPGN